MSVVKKIQGHSIPIASFTCQVVNTTMYKRQSELN